MQSLYDKAHMVLGLLSFLTVLLAAISLNLWLRQRALCRRLKGLEWENSILKDAVMRVDKVAQPRINGTPR